MVIVAAVDTSERARVVLDEAESVARAFEEEIHVVHVLSRSAFVELGSTRAEAGDPVDMEEVRAVARDIAADAAADLDVPAKPVGLMGSRGDRVVEYADEHDARYIVVSGRKRSPAGKVFFGSVTQTILLNATGPVITIIGRPREE